MLSLQRRNFYGVIQKHFFIDLSRREEDRELIALSEKSNVPLDELRRLVNLLETKEAFEVSDDTIVTVHKLKQEFYKKAGIVAEHVNERALKKATVVYRRLTVPAILLLVGIVALFYGFYLLVDAHGIGVALWPIGALILFLAVRQIRKPLVYIDEDKFTYTPSFGRSRNFDRLDLIRAEWDDNTIQLLFKGQITITINQNEMGRQEKAKLMRALMRIKTDELW